MLRILLWKTYSECLNGWKWSGLPQPRRRLYYFAFGANVNADVLRARDMHPSSSRAFTLEGYEFGFTHPGPYEGMGWASIEKKSGARTYGVLHELSWLDARRMDCFEAVPFLRRHRRVVETRDGVSLYFYQSRSPRADLKPLREYRDRIVAGLKGLAPEEHLVKLGGTPPLEVLVPSTKPEFLYRVRPWMPTFMAKAILALDREIYRIYSTRIRDFTFF